MSRSFKDTVMGFCNRHIYFVAKRECVRKMERGSHKGKYIFDGQYMECPHGTAADKGEPKIYDTCSYELEIRYLSDKTIVASQALNIVCDRSEFFKNIFGDILDGTHTANMDFKLDSFNVVKRDDGVTVYQMYIDDVECSVATWCMEVFFTLLCMEPDRVIDYILGLQIMNGIWSIIRLIRNGAFEVYKLADYYQYTDLCLLLEKNMECIFDNEWHRCQALSYYPDVYARSQWDLVKTGFLRYDAKQVKEYLESTGNGGALIRSVNDVVRNNEKHILNEHAQGGVNRFHVNERDLARLDELVRANRASETVNPIIRMNDKGEWRILNFFELRKR